MSPQLPPLDPLLLSELRLSVMAILIQEEEADFLYLKANTGATGGNLSVQIDKLSTAGYVEVEKGFVGKRTRTTCKITEVGRQAFKDHFEALRRYFPTGDIG